MSSVARIQPAASDADALAQAIGAACRAIAPLWPLRHFVAVNPYLGFTSEPFHRATERVAEAFHAEGLMPLAWYRDRHREGRIGDEDLASALADAARWLGRPELVREAEAAVRQELRAEDPPAGDRPGLPTFAEAVDAVTGARFETTIRNEISKWCSARFDAGQAAWRQPWAERGIYAAWRAWARHDRSPELQGLAGFRATVETLPEDPRQTIAAVLRELGVAPEEQQAFLTRSLASISGWAGHVSYRVREAALRGRSDDGLEQMLALRLAFDAALHRARGSRGTWRTLRAAAELSSPPPARTHRLSGREARFVWQLALEAAYRRELTTRIAERAPARGDATSRPRLQAVFCIDVRSEPLRRHLEAQSPAIRTIGFAGFFGMPIEYVGFEDEVGGARCPVLIPPGYRIREANRGGPAVTEHFELEEERHRTFKAMRLSTVSAFPFVETVGHFFGLRLVTDALGITRPRADGRLFPSQARAGLGPEVEPDASAGSGLRHAERVALAEGALRNMGLVDGFAEVVLLCGHGSETTNNPYGSGLDCGACGGHRGDVNARVAAAILGDPAVRKDLAARGIEIPDDTVFVAGLHETTTDTVELLDADAIPAELRATIRGWLAEAAGRTRRERLARLGATGDATEEVRRRSRDWSELRPEWGLARNAAFVAAPRARTRGLDLDGRTFLHDYDPALDEEGKVLDLVLSAPMVVASWINLQYFASTVDPEVFGSGDKTLHNVVGRHGVMLGNRSDLRPGLPWQSVHDGQRFVHEPLRLLALVEAPLERIASVLDAHPEVRALLDNGWVELVAIDPVDGTFRRRVDGRFQTLRDGASPGAAQATGR